jgi:hypothetical protein
MKMALKEKVADWNRIEQELETLWQENGKPRGAAWKKLAAPMWDERGKLEDDLAPLLLDWVKENDLGFYGHTIFGFDGFQPAKGGYAEIKAQTGIKAQTSSKAASRQIGQLLVHGGRIRKAEADKKRILAMTDEEFERDFCDKTDEGKELKAYYRKLRAA